MRKIIFMMMSMLLLASCDVHEWPALPEKVALALKLEYETDMTILEHIYEKNVITEVGKGEVYDNHQNSGQIRYIVRTYPITGKSRSSQSHQQEFVFTKAIEDGYDHEVMLDIIPGEYRIMVWSDLIQNEGDLLMYDASNFFEVTLLGEHSGSNDYRDAFSASSDLTVVADYMEHIPDTLTLKMQRPLAKYEFITDDLQEFLDEEMAYLSKVAETKGEDAPTRVNTDDYKVVIKYSGYMPNTFNINSDKPIDSATGVLFESRIDPLNSTEASIGFDYVFVNGSQAGVSVQVGLYAKSDNRQVALSEPIIIPLYRSHHSVLRGSFLTSKASGGLKIDASFDGNHNIVIE